MAAGVKPSAVAGLSCAALRCHGRSQDHHAKGALGHHRPAQDARPDFPMPPDVPTPSRHHRARQAPSLLQNHLQQTGNFSRALLLGAVQKRAKKTAVFATNGPSLATSCFSVESEKSLDSIGLYGDFEW